MEDADPEQLKYLLLAREQDGMSDDVFQQALALLPRCGAAAAGPGAGPSATSDGRGVGLDVEGEPQEVPPPGLTSEERAAWDRDGFFWRRGVFTPNEVQAAKREIRAACDESVAPLGMITGPGARVFFADDPTAPEW